MFAFVLSPGETKSDKEREREREIERDFFLKSASGRFEPTTPV